MGPVTQCAGMGALTKQVWRRSAWWAHPAASDQQDGGQRNLRTLSSQVAMTRTLRSKIQIAWIVWTALGESGLETLEGDGRPGRRLAKEWPR